ncbi:MAG: hypothetical protein AAB870_04970 [Patescibacteria group bacterium]
MEEQMKCENCQCGTEGPKCGNCKGDCADTKQCNEDGMGDEMDGKDRTDEGNSCKCC